MTKSPLKSVIVAQSQDVIKKINASKDSEGKAKSSTKPATSNTINKEVLLVLKELNGNLNSQNKRIEKQDKQISSLTDRLDSLFNFANDNSYDFYDQSEFPGKKDDFNVVDEILSLLLKNVNWTVIIHCSNH